MVDRWRAKVKLVSWGLVTDRSAHLYNEAVLVKLLQNFANNLTDHLQCPKVFFGFVVLRYEVLNACSVTFEPRFELSQLPELFTVGVQRGEAVFLRIHVESETLYLWLSVGVNSAVNRQTPSRLGRFRSKIKEAWRDAKPAARSH
jgi:hypothetical protein